MLARGHYGVEWTEHPRDPESPWLLRLAFIIIVIAGIAFIVSLAKRAWLRSHEPIEEAVCLEQTPAQPSSASIVQRPPVQLVQSMSAELMKRPPKLRALLLRLEEAEKNRDTEMAISTIEQIREMKDALDLDDAFARRLGELNFTRLFAQKCAQWVTMVTVKRGDSLSRIASEHGSTIASTRRLNDGIVSVLKAGQKIAVLDHPRFNLIVRRRARIADLMLNGKFFKRYDLVDESGVDGVYQVTFPIRDFWVAVHLVWKVNDRAELEMLLSKGSKVTISKS